MRPLGRRYVVEEHPSEAVARELAAALRRVLRSWGAGKRGAPQLLNEKDIVATFLDSRLHSGVVKLAGLSIANLGFDEALRRVVNGVHNREVLGDFDATLLFVLRKFSDRIFVGNTNVTYPTKALLLVSGLTPALDSRVRTGLGRAELKGVDKTQFFLPTEMHGADAKKLTRLPFILGQCWADYNVQLQEGIRQSKVNALLQEPGRIFDILFFMQAKEGQLPLLSLDPGRDSWYELA